MSLHTKRLVGEQSGLGADGAPRSRSDRQIGRLARVLVGLTAGSLCSLFLSPANAATSKSLVVEAGPNDCGDFYLPNESYIPEEEDSITVNTAGKYGGFILWNLDKSEMSLPYSQRLVAFGILSHGLGPQKGAQIKQSPKRSDGSSEPAPLRRGNYRLCFLGDSKGKARLMLSGLKKDIRLTPAMLQKHTTSRSKTKKLMGEDSVNDVGTTNSFSEPVRVTRNTWAVVGLQMYSQRVTTDVYTAKVCLRKYETPCRFGWTGVHQSRNPLNESYVSLVYTHANSPGNKKPAYYEAYVEATSLTAHTGQLTAVEVSAELPGFNGK